MMKAMISQPMAGKTDGEIAETRERAKAKLEEMGYEFVNTLFTDEWYSDEAMKERGVVQVPLCYLAKSLENMSLCHAAYFAKGWETARGCRIEHDAAVAYGLDVLYEDSDEQRREIAGKLRSLDERIEGMPLMCTKQEHNAMALRAIRAVVGKGDIFHLLADLIDRPTCRNIYAETEKFGYENGFKCSECGNMVEDYEGYRISGEFNYCSKCGARVVVE